MSSKNRDCPRDATRCGGFLRMVANLCFGLFVFLILVTPSLRDGAFVWWPLLRLPMLAGAPTDVGLLSMLPVVVAACGWLTRLVERPRRPWQWGRLAVTLPLLTLSILTVASLDAALSWRTVVAGVSMVLMWLTYLYVPNSRVDLTVPVALSAVVQGAVGAAQFWTQRDLGLALLGELPLDPTVRGVSIVWDASQPYLRAYGLTAHPNVLGATLCILLLFLLPRLAQARRLGLVGLVVCCSVGVLGLLVSFSRASWLAFVVGAVLWLLAEVRRLRVQHERVASLLSRLLPRLVVPVLLALVFLFFYRQLVVGRFVALDVETEAQSLRDRTEFTVVALELIRRYPWRGVGFGLYETAAREVYPYARTVHSIPLLVTAELGIVGLAAWAWLGVGGLMGPALGLWTAWLVAGLFDTALWFTTSWRAAVLFAIIAAQVASSAPRYSMLPEGCK